MTNEELDNAREIEAIRIYDLEQNDSNGHGLARIAARLAREGWTPPVQVDPDFAEAKELALDWMEDALSFEDLALAGIKRGRELERAEAKPGMVWVKHDRSGECPVDPNQRVCVLLPSSDVVVGKAAWAVWETITHYAVITPPEGVA